VTSPISGTLGDMARAEDAELAADLVGVSSARLLAAGIPRDERTSALRLLGILAMVADRDQRVRRPLADIAREFELSPTDADRWAGHLEAVGAVERRDDGLVLAGAEPAYAGGLRLHDFLDAATDLDRVAPRREVRHLLRPLSTALAAAALLLAILAAPGLLRQEATPVSSEADAPSETTTAGSNGGRADGTATTTGPTTGSGTPSTEAGGSVTPTTASKPIATPPGETTTTLVPPLPECPSGAPFIEILDTSTDLSGNLVVSGVVRNASSTAMTVRTFTLQAIVLGQPVAGPGTEQPLSVAPGSSAPWQATLPVIAAPGTTIEAVLGDWSWDDPDVPAGCGAP
jgi:hypothetical protein